MVTCRVDAGPRTAFLVPEHSPGRQSGRGARGHLFKVPNGLCRLFGRLQSLHFPMRFTLPPLRRFALLCLLGVLATASAPLFASDRPAVIPFPSAPGKVVPPSVMQQIHDEVKTPNKYGVVLKGGEGELVDCPNVFRHGDTWYMMYVAIKDKVGYETYLARSEDLLHWEKLGKILSFRREGWDVWQADGGIALYDTQWNGRHALGRHGGRYWLSYIGGAKQGYEPDPLAIGLAHAEEPTVIAEWTRLPENPVLHSDQGDVRAFEKTTLYKSAIVRDTAESLGWPFVMFYNGKAPPDGHEAIGMAVSRDLRTWHRYGSDSIIHNKGESRWAISGDPQITKIGDVWVMFYFGAFWKPDAFDTFACSYDLVNWTMWEGPHLVAPSEPYDKQFAHKPWVLKHDGVVYHYYCAVGSEGRVIALATSRDLSGREKKQP